MRELIRLPLRLSQLQTERCKLLLLLARAALASRAVSVALPNALAAASLAKQLRMGALVAECGALNSVLCMRRDLS